MQSERQASPNSKAGFERPTRKPAGLIAANPSRAREREMAALQPARSGSAQVVLVVPLVPMPVPLARMKSRFVAYGTLRILTSTPGRYRLVVSSCRACSRSNVV